MNLDEIRVKIDEIDAQILDLFCKRMDLVKGVAAYKIANDMPVLRPEREQQILEKVRINGGEEYGGYAVRLFETAMEVSRDMQTEMIRQKQEQDK